jgi:hypothetical protein
MTLIFGGGSKRSNVCRVWLKSVKELELWAMAFPLRGIFWLWSSWLCLSVVLVYGYQRFRRTCCLHLQGRFLSDPDKVTLDAHFLAGTLFCASSCRRKWRSRVLNLLLRHGEGECWQRGGDGVVRETKLRKGQVTNLFFSLQYWRFPGIASMMFVGILLMNSVPASS